MAKTTFWQCLRTKQTIGTSNQPVLRRTHILQYRPFIADRYYFQDGSEFLVKWVEYEIADEEWFVTAEDDESVLNDEWTEQEAIDSYLSSGWILDK